MIYYYIRCLKEKVSDEILYTLANLSIYQKELIIKSQI